MKQYKIGFRGFCVCGLGLKQTAPAAGAVGPLKRKQGNKEIKNIEHRIQ